MVARHDKYYFEDGNVVFQVGEKLYRIHKRILVGSESSVFTSVFSLPQCQNTEGQTDEKPILLEAEDPEEFEALMRILYPPPLKNVLDTPIATYILAMRIAIKWSMDDIQLAITKAIQIRPRPLRTEILRLAFVAEFQSYFSQDFAIEIFTNACSLKYHPTANDLRPLMAHPAFVVLLIQYREGRGNYDAAIWNVRRCGKDGRPVQRMDAETWLTEQFTSFGFKPRT